MDKLGPEYGAGTYVLARASFYLSYERQCYDFRQSAVYASRFAYIWVL